MTLSTVQKEAWVWGIALVVAVGSFAGFVGHERAIGALNARLHTLDSLRVVQVDSVATVAQGAQHAAKVADAQKVQAIKQVAVSESLRRVADSVAKTSSAERDSARRLLADSLASVGQYRAEVARLVEAGVRDSAASRASHQADEASLRSLMATITADSSALSAERSRSASLQALNATLAQEVKLLRGQQPSFVSRHLGVGPGYVCTKQGCDVGAAVIVRVLP